MKKYTTTLLLAIIGYGCFGQNNSLLVRHDTTLLLANEGEWILRSLVKNDPSLTVQTGKSVPQIILEAIEKGGLTAIDPQTNQPIPGKEIFTWNMPVDSVMQADSPGKITKYVARKHQLNPSAIAQIRIFQDWYMDVSTGRFQSVIKWIELVQEVSTSTGVFIGYKPFCRIY